MWIIILQILCILLPLTIKLNLQCNVKLDTVKSWKKSVLNQTLSTYWKEKKSASETTQIMISGLKRKSNCSYDANTCNFEQDSKKNWKDR